MLKSPYPYFGGKSRVADLVWKRLGDPMNYVVSSSLFFIAETGTPNSLEHFVIDLHDAYSAIASDMLFSVQVIGCPVFFVALFVDHLIDLRAAIKAAMLFSLNSVLCIAKCLLLLTSSRLSIESFSLFPSLWCINSPFGIAPCSSSHTLRERRTQTFGCATLIKARFSFPLLCRVRTLISPMFNINSDGLPLVNVPFEFLIKKLYVKINTVSSYGLIL